MDELPLTFGEFIKRRRKALDLTQADLAQRSGCSVFTMRKIESGERKPSKQLAALLCKALQIDPGEEEAFVKAARGEARAGRLALPAIPINLAAITDQASLTPSVSLPTQLTPLIGRENELSTLEHLLQDSTCRLLTITGPGGIGKTRLALALAESQLDLFPAGVYYAALASLSSPEYIAPALAETLGMVFSGPTNPDEQLIKHLASHTRQPLLLVLDNVEHLLGAADSPVAANDVASLVAKILQSAPLVKVLATSRERLNLQSEWSFELQGLPVPSSEQVTEAVSSSAIALFLQSARRVRAGFELTAQEVPAALRICRLAEGMPLAIELAAAWVNVLSCQEIAQEIEANLDFLSTSLRDMPARHRSLRTMFDHSWKLLSSEERGAMRHLSIFRGGFKREAAQKVAGASLALLGSLLSKSLLRRSAAGRYDMHELTRQYVLLKLQADEGEHTAARDRHCQYYMARLQDWGAMLSSHTPQEAMHAMLGEMDNLRLAWEWSVRQQRLDLIKNSLRCFYLFFDTRSLYQEATELFAKASQALQDSPRGDGSMVERQLTQGLTLTYQGWFIFRMGRQGEARRLLDGALALLRDLGDWAVCPETLIHNGIVTYLTGDYTAGSLLVNEGLSLAEARQDIWYVALGLSNQGILAHAMGDYESAHDRMLSGLALWKQVGDPRAVAFALNFLSPLLIDMDCLSEADARLHESLALSESIGNRLGMGTAYANMGVIAERRGDLASACALIRQALDIFNDLGAYWDVAWARVHLSRSLTAMGEMGEARRILLDTTRLANQIEAMPIVVDALVGLADLLALEGDAEGALKLAQFVLDQPASKAKTKEFARCLVDRAYGQMAPEQVKAARLWASGQPAQKVVESYLAGR